MSIKGGNVLYMDSMYGIHVCIYVYVYTYICIYIRLSIYADIYVYIYIEQNTIEYNLN